MNRSRQRVAALLAGCAVATAAAGWPGAASGVSLSRTMTLAVVPFANTGNGKPADLPNLTRAMQEAIVDHLRAGGRVTVLEPSVVEGALKALHMGAITSPAAAVKLGKHLQVTGVVYGTFRRPGADEVRADAVLVRVADGRTLSRANSYGNDLMTEGAIETMGDILSQGLIATLREDGTIAPPVGRALTLTTSTNSDLVGTGGGRVSVQIDLRAAEMERRGARAPLNISLVMDRSGSMAGEKLEYTKQAARTLVNSLSSTDYFSLIVFDDTVQVLVPAGPARDKQRLLKVIDNIDDGGSTNLGGGMAAGYAQVARYLEKQRVNRVLLLSDGLANVGEVDPERLQSSASAQSKEGITISTLGVGLDYNENLMLALSRSGRGNYYFIESPESIPNIVASEAKGLLNVVAKDVRLEVTLAPGVRLAELSGYTYRQEGTHVSIDVPDLFSKDYRYVIMDLDVPSGSANSWRPLAQVEARYHDLLSGTKNAWTQAAAAVRYTPDQKNVLRHERRDVVANVAVVRSARAMEQAGQMLDKGDRDAARKVLQQAKERLTKDNKRINRPSVQAEVNALGSMDDALAAPAAAAGPEAQRAKKNIQFQSNQRYQNRR